MREIVGAVKEKDYLSVKILHPLDLKATVLIKKVILELTGLLF